MGARGATSPLSIVAGYGRLWRTIGIATGQRAVSTGVGRRTPPQSTEDLADLWRLLHQWIYIRLLHIY